MQIYLMIITAKAIYFTDFQFKGIYLSHFYCYGGNSALIRA